MLRSKRLRRWGWIILIGPVLLYLLHEARSAESNDCAVPRRGTAADYGTACHAVGVDGLTRTYRIFTPRAGHDQPLALVFVLHGGGGTGIGMARKTGRDFHRLAQRDGAIIVYPDGVERQWNDGRSDFNSRAHTENIDDVGFISRLIDVIAADYAIDKDRVYVTGVSNGGMMSFRLACGLSDRLAAAAPVIANMPADLIRVCAPGDPISILVTNGTEDRLMPFDGGRVGAGARQRGRVVSTDRSMAFWARHGGCTPAAEADLLPDRAPADGTRLERTIWRNCIAGVSVILNTIVGGGHTWPGGQPGVLPELSGRVSQELDGVEEVWAFLMAHPRSP